MTRKAWRIYRPGKLGQNTLLGTAGLGARAIIQAGYLLAASRWLGAEGYGWFSGAVALAILGTPLANWGSSYLIPRHIARNRSSSRAIWATALAQTGIIGGLLSAGMIFLATMLPQQPLAWMPLLMLALSELVLLPITHAATSHCYALERGMVSAASMCLVPLGRLAWLLGFMGLGLGASPENAALAHFIGSLSGAVVAVVLVAWIDGWPMWCARLGFLQATREGSSYALSHAAGTSYQEVDKILMLQILGAAAVGTYTVAFRVSSIFVLPISALVGASLARLMRQHEHGEDARHTHSAMLRVALGYGLLAGIGMLFFSPWASWVFGEEYASASRLIMLLSPWPLLFSVRQVYATRLTASGRQRSRTAADLAGLAIIALLNLLLLPRAGEAGAAFSLLATEFLLAAFLLTAAKMKCTPDNG